MSEMARSYLPECWEDDSRMNAMFSPFRSRDANPQAWDSKVQFWKNCLFEWCRSTKRVYFSVSELLLAFERDDKSPQGLQTVISELLRQKDLIKLSDYGSLEDDDKWLSWGINVLVKRPLSWSVAAFSNALVKTENSEEECVVTDIIKKKAQEVIHIHQATVEYPSTDNVVELTALWERCKDICRSEKEFHLILVYMRREKMIKVHISNDVKLLKFKHKDESSVSAITEADIGILRLKRATEFLQSRIKKLEDDIKNHTSEARQHLKSNDKPLARTALRRKKSCEKVLAKREVALDNIEQLLHRIQEVESEKMVLDAYQSGVNGFRKTLAESGITIDKVDNTVVEIQEMFDMHEEIQDSLSHPIAGEADMSELEAELDDLLTTIEPPPAPLEPPTLPPSPRKDEEISIPDLTHLLKDQLSVSDADPLPPLVPREYESESNVPLLAE